jgi:hypothetical protein
MPTNEDAFPSLHSAASHWLKCRDQGYYEEVCELAQQSERLENYTEDELRLMLRRAVLRAIWDEIGEVTPAGGSFSELKNEILDIARRATNEDAEEYGEALSTGTSEMGAERWAFHDFVTASKLLEPDAAKRVLDTLESRWDIDPSKHWFPLTERGGDDICAFRDDRFQTGATETVERILAAHHVTRIWQVDEAGRVFEVPCEHPDFSYRWGDERYWTSEALDWVIYASHEGSITVAGWLLHELVLEWPEWESARWKTPWYKLDRELLLRRAVEDMENNEWSEARDIALNVLQSAKLLADPSDWRLAFDVLAASSTAISTGSVEAGSEPYPLEAPARRAADAPDDALALLGLARAMVRHGHEIRLTYPEVTVLTRALSIDPDNAEVRAELENALESIGHPGLDVCESLDILEETGLSRSSSRLQTLVRKLRAQDRA